MSGLPSRTAAILVTFGDEHRVQTTLRALAGTLGAVVVVDNRPQPLPSLAGACASVQAVFLHNGNQGMLAGAYNLALDWLRTHRPDVRQVLFLDEDTDAGKVSAFLQDAVTAEVLDRPEAAAISAAYRDRATGLRGRYLRLSRWRPHYMGREFADVREVAFVINSMSLWKIDALGHIGRFDETLALDHIDTDACLRARRLGLKLYVHGRHEFLHSIGQRRRFHVLGREMQASGHEPPRRYMLGLNTLRLARREALREPGFALLCISRMAYEAVGILVVETDKAAKLAALVRGVLRGLLRR